jgi:hypothetical protein
MFHDLELLPLIIVAVLWFSFFENNEEGSFSLDCGILSEKFG